MADKKKGKNKSQEKKQEKKPIKLSEKKETGEKKEKDLPPLPPNLTEEQLVEFKEAFDLLNDSEEPKIPALNVVTLMRKLGIMPRDDDVMQIIEEMDPEGILAYDGLAFEHFCCVAAKKIHEVYTANDIIMAFKIFDENETGLIHIDEIKRILQKMGDPLTDEEMDALIDNTQSDANGNVKYEDFVKEMMLEF